MHELKEAHDMVPRTESDDNRPDEKSHFGLTTPYMSETAGSPRFTVMRVDDYESFHHEYLISI